MRLALLGSDDDVVALARAARDAGHELAWCGDMLPQHLAELAVLRPSRDDWEVLLDDQFCDGVIVGHGAATTDLRMEQLQKLVGNEIPVLITRLPVDSVLPFHEIDMLRREKRSLVQHYHPEIDHPWIALLAQSCGDGESELGTVQQISLERGMIGSDRESVIAALARDIELLERLAGVLTSVSAIGATGDAQQLRGLTVQLIGPSEIPVRWSLAPPGASRLTLVGENQRLTVEIPPPPAAWRAEGETAALGAPPEFDAARHAIDEYTWALAALHRGEIAAEYSTWESATAAMEVADVVELSLQKGRTIEVHHQQLTEDLAFRGTMSALGCGLLIVALVGVVLAGIFGDVLGFPIKTLWPIMLLGVFGVFLLLQLVPKLFPPRDS
ncbi:MAG: hypothetical protein WD851_12600 [Pirellulales bacterium]